MSRSIAPGPPIPTPRSTGRLGRDTWWAWLFLAPTILGLAVLSAGPIIASFGISLTDWDLLSPAKFVGLDNFATLVSSDRFLLALRNTAFFTLTSVPLGLILALGLALALDQPIRGIAIIRTAYFLPVVTSTTAIALVWLWIYSPQGGLLNTMLGTFGIPAQKWVSDPFWSMPSIVIMSVWQGLG
ncbi:MAG TPA: sugar ABC transporter permease, partial [Acidimicrobiales bacterium]|nr:sugar ABC transporter permease [Acidimicrobiales bacterium]